MLGRLDAVSAAVLEERLAGLHEVMDEIRDALRAQNGRLRSVEELQAEAKGAGRVKERISNLVSAIVGGLVVAAGKLWLGGG